MERFDPTLSAPPLLCVCVSQKLYKVLSEVKGEVETVIKTGRQIVQKQQTEQPKEMDDRVTALKLLYNQLGSQVRKHTHTRYAHMIIQVRFRHLFVCVCR